MKHEVTALGVMLGIGVGLLLAAVYRSMQRSA